MSLVLIVFCLLLVGVTGSLAGKYLARIYARKQIDN